MHNLSMKLIIGVGSVGFEALLYFESNFSNIPGCALLLSDKKFEERAKKSSSRRQRKLTTLIYLRYKEPSLRFPPDLQKWNNIKLGI